MIGELGFPKGLFAVEKDLAQLSNLDASRRIDILCYRPAPGGLSPLLLIECKAGPIKSQAYFQLFGYNDSISAPFFALANESEIKMFWKEPGKMASVPFLPSFAQLLEQACQI